MRHSLLITACHWPKETKRGRKVVRHLTKDCSLNWSLGFSVYSTFAVPVVGKDILGTCSRRHEHISSSDWRKVGRKRHSRSTAINDLQENEKHATCDNVPVSGAEQSHRVSICAEEACCSEISFCQLQRVRWTTAWKGRKDKNKKKGQSRGSSLLALVEKWQQEERLVGEDAMAVL